MASALQQQLRSIAVAAGLQGNDTRDQRSSKQTGTKSTFIRFPSVLYSEDVASDIHIDELYNQALAAYSHLVKLDPRFAQTRKSLFSVPSAALRIHSADADQRAELDGRVDIFCRLLQPYFITSYAQHALEYLIRMFHVHEHNVESLMKCGLVHHGCVEFSRLVRVCRVEGTMFEFLSAMKGDSSGTEGKLLRVSREVLVARMGVDRAFWRFVCEMAKEASVGEWKVVGGGGGGSGSAAGGNSGVLMGWYGAVMCEVIGAMADVGEDVVGFLLPYVVSGLRSGVVGGYRDATCMVVGGLSGKVVMRGELVDALVRDIASSATPASLPQTLLILSYLATSQRDNLTALAPQAFGHLSRLPNLASEMSKLTRKKVKASRFGYLLLCAAVEQVLSDSGEADGGDASTRNYDALVKATVIGLFASDLAALFLEKATKPLQAAKKGRLIEMMKLFDVYHGDAMDKAVNAYLASDSGRSDASGRKNVLAVLEASLEDTVRAPLLDANVTLSAGIDHAQASVRIMALERLNEICSQSDSKLKEEAQITLKSALSRRLEDEDMGVLLTALNLSTLSDLVPEAVLTDALVQCVERCITAVYDRGSGKRTRGLGRKAAKAALRRLDGLERGGSSSDASVVLTAALLSAIFAGQASYTVSMEALKILTEGSGPLAKPLKGCLQKYAPGVAKKSASQPGGKATPKGGSKRSRDGNANAHSDGSTGMSHNFDLSGFNREVTVNLAKAALADEDAYRQLLAVLTCDSPCSSPQSKATVLCILEQSIMMSASDKKMASKRESIAGDVVQWFYGGREQPDTAARKSHRGLRALWDSKSNCISDQTLSDMASRACTLSSVEPEAVFMCIEAASKHAFDPASNTATSAKKKKGSELPKPADLYKYLAKLENEVYSQHLDVLLNKVDDPLNMLTSVWLGAAAAGTTEGGDTSSLVASLRQWATYASSGDRKLTETDKKRIVESVVPLVCSMTHPSGDVRRAALEAAGLLMGSMNVWWPSKGTAKWTTQGVIESLLELCTKNSARILGDADGIEYLLQQVAETTSAHGKQRKKGKSPRASQSRPNPLLYDAEGLCSFLMQELCDGQASPATIPILVRTLEFSSEADRLCDVASKILDKMFYDIETEAFRSVLDPNEKAAAVELVNVLNDPVLHQSASSKTKNMVLKSSLCAAEWKGHADLREVALKSLAHCARGQPTCQDMQSICRVLMAVASSESNSECRKAALETLDKMSVQPEVIMPFLQLSNGAPSSSKRRRKDVDTMPSVEASASTSLCLHTLEMMQWKKNIRDMDLFVEPLQGLVQHFLGLSLSVDTNAGDDPEDIAPSNTQGPAVAGYGLQLCLNVLLSISEDASLERKTRDLFDTKAIVACASSASDHAVRTVALDLLRSRIESNPEGAMDQILKTVQTICSVVSNELDKYSTSLAAKTMSTAAAAWIGRGNSIHELVSNVIDAISDTSTSRKYAILGAIVESMPSNAAETMASIAYHLLLSSSNRGADEEGESWQQDTAFNMLSKRKKTLCVSALGGMLQLCIGCSKKSKFSILRQANKIANKVLKTHSDSLRRLQEQSTERANELVEAYEAIMQSILMELQVVGRSRAKNSDPMLLELEEGAYAVLDSLMDTMNHVQFINSLVRSLSYKEMTDAMRRKSLNLISHVVTIELSAVDAKDPAFQPCVHDAIGALVLLVQDAKSQTDICRQMALETMSGFIQRFGTYYKDVFLQAIPPIVDLAREAELPGVRGMALICIASFVNSMKDAVIPMVPRMIESVVSSMSASLDAASASDEEASDAENAAALAALNALSEHLPAFLAPNLHDILDILLREDFCVSSSGPPEDDGLSKSSSPHNVQALSSACRSNIASSVPSRLLIGPLSTMLDTVMEEVRNDDPKDRRERHSALHLMDMLAAVISNMDSTAVATYGGDIFSMILKSLDTRRLYSVISAAEASTESPNRLRSKHLSATETSTVNCMLQLVLKLNETKFKPIFYRLLEWATRAPPGETESSLARKIAFFNVINTLTENLKSVFTTYFSALVEPFLDALLYEADEEDEHDIAAVNTLQLLAMRSLTRCFMYDTSEFLDESTFDKLLEPLINLMTTPRPACKGSTKTNKTANAAKTARGSKKNQTAKPDKSISPGELFDSIDLVDPVIENTVSTSCSDWMRAELSTFSKTIIACLSQMAMASGMNNGEARWRPLHHAVLMATRSNYADSRCTALETVMAICTTLQEEYLVLVPEALPFLSELLEDEDARVERRAVEVINAMSEKSGEDLQQYLTS